MDLVLDPSLARGLHGPTQVARVLTQGWVEREMFCLRCESRRLGPTRQNSKSRDFECRSCDEPYELKSTAGSFGAKILDGEYRTMVDTLLKGRNPNLLLLEYDRPHLEVTGLEVVHRTLLTPHSVIPRNHPLPPTARRAGWLGCSIDLSALPHEARIPIISKKILRDRDAVRRDWNRFEFMVNLTPIRRGWLSDTLVCAERLTRGRPFTLSDIYGFEETLSRLHPGNRNIRPKIRQQLQILVRKGLITRVKPGQYIRQGTPEMSNAQVVPVRAAE